jgi:hypothetical protein
MHCVPVHGAWIDRSPIQYIEYLVHDIGILVFLAHGEESDYGGIPVDEPELENLAHVRL